MTKKLSDAATRKDRRKAANRVLRLAIGASDTLLKKERIDAAALILERYLAAHPPNRAVCRRLGNLRLKQGRPQDAAEMFRLALDSPRGAG